MICTFEQVSETRKACSFCGQQVTLDAPEPIRHLCDAEHVAAVASFPKRSPGAASEDLPGVESLPCVHRGEQLRAMPCRLCGWAGRVEPVYACTVHGECSMRAWDAGKRGHVKGMCLTCTDRVEAT